MRAIICHSSSISVSAVMAIIAFCRSRVLTCAIITSLSHITAAAAVLVREMRRDCPFAIIEASIGATEWLIIHTESTIPGSAMRTKGLRQ